MPIGIRQTAPLFYAGSGYFQEPAQFSILDKSIPPSVHLLSRIIKDIISRIACFQNNNCISVADTIFLRNFMILKRFSR